METEKEKQKSCSDVKEKKNIGSDQIGSFQEEILRICPKCVLKSYLGKVSCDISPLQTTLVNVLPFFLIVNILWN